MTDSNLHKRLSALGCPVKDRPDEAGEVVWDNPGDLFGDGFKVSLAWGPNELTMRGTVRLAGSDSDLPHWSFRWERETMSNGRPQWKLAEVSGDPLNGVTALEQTVAFARDKVKAVGVAPRWTHTSPLLAMPLRAKGPSC